VRVPTQASLMIFTPYEYPHWLSVSTDSEHSHQRLRASQLIRSQGALTLAVAVLDHHMIRRPACSFGFGATSRNASD
jgi:hypothetical protein